jgi:hypothetical protein
MRRLREAVRRKSPKLWPDDWILHHNNALIYNSLSVKQFMAQKSISEMEHPPFFPDLAPNDFWLFPKIKSDSKGRRFPDIENIKKKKKVTVALEDIPQQKFQKIFPTVAASLC